MNGQVARRMFTTDEYHRMGAAGILSAQDRVELIEGEIIRMSPIGSRHAACVDRLTALFGQRLRKRAIVRVQGPIVLGRLSEPEPDLTLIKARADFYSGQHPTASDVLLVVEVADTSHEHDRGTKLQLYARFGIPEVWIVDLSRGVIETYRRPALRAYRLSAEYERGRRLAPAAFPRTTFRVNDILG